MLFTYVSKHFWLLIVARFYFVFNHTFFHLLILFTLDSENCSECDKVINDLENIDTETDKHAIAFVKTADTSIASEYGCKTLPALIYFKKQMPNIYQADLSEEEDVLHWIIQQKTDDTIESVNRDLLEQLIETSHYLVVYFCE